MIRNLVVSVTGVLAGLALLLFFIPGQNPDNSPVPKSAPVTLASGTANGEDWRLVAQSEPIPRDKNGRTALLCMILDVPSTHTTSGGCGFDEDNPSNGYFAVGVGPSESAYTFGPLPAEATNVEVSGYKRGVDGYQRPQEELVCLATRLSVVREARLSWLATNMNAAVAPARFVDRVEDLPDHLDVEVLETEQWADTPEDGGRKQRRMAELLVHGCVPWTVFTHVAVHSEAEAGRLRALLPERSRPAVIVRAGWYF